MSTPLVPRVQRCCPICGTSYLAAPYRLKHGRQTTCSRACSYQLRAQSGPKSGASRRKPPEHHQAYKWAKDARYRAAHREQLKARVQQYREQHRAELAPKQLMMTHRRRARLQNAPINDLTLAQWREIQAAWHYRCAYCGCQPPRLTQDHVIPLSKGGSHTKSNVVPACRSCNNRKQARLLSPSLQNPL